MQWVDEIYDAYAALGGAARYSDLYEYIEATTNRDLTEHWRSSVRRTVQQHSSDSESFAYEDVFKHVGRGFWALREARVTDEFLARREAQSPEEVVRDVLVKQHWRSKPTFDGSSVTPPSFHMIDGGPRPVAPFSHAVEADGWVILTGQMPTDAAAPDAPLPEGIEAQTRAVMTNLEIVLGGLGLDLSHVVQCRCFLTEFERDYTAFNETYQSYFPVDRRPARTTVGVTALAVGALVEIDCVARRP